MNVRLMPSFEGVISISVYECCPQKSPLAFHFRVVSQSDYSECPKILILSSIHTGASKKEKTSQVVEER
ncbi:CLUMA_CG016724, isoform A [Clunio marinus]|uniref:CLUMA_CG016724, isoform A n=1 Tax=Clunio marinus TaxID=568069 RepID=A0A1J1ISF2_9DIPT|nr:CLUMA_CG016724, isoform A [Clunio marinus]